MTLKIPYKQIFLSLALAGLALILAFQALLISLPYIATAVVKSRLRPYIAQNLSMDFSIAAIGLSRILIHDLHLGRDISVQTAELTYRILGETPFALETVRLSGIRLNASAVKDKDRWQVMVNGLPLLPESTAEENKENPDTDPVLTREMIQPYAAFIPRRVSLNHGELNLKVNGTRLHLPFGGRAVVSPETAGVEAHATVHAMGTPIRITAGGGLDQGLGHFALESRGINPAAFMPALGLGNIHAQGPMDIRFIQEAPHLWDLSLDNLALKSGEGWQVRLNHLKGKIDIRDRAFSLENSLTVSRGSTTVIPFQLTATGRAGEMLEFEMVSGELETLAFEAGAMLPVLKTVALSRPALRLKSSGSFERQHLTLETGADHMILGFDPLSAVIKSAGLTASTDLDLGNLTAPLLVDWKARTGKVQVSGVPSEVDVMNTTASGQLNLHPQGPDYLNAGQARISLAGITGRQRDTTVRLKDLIAVADTTAEQGQHRIGLDIRGRGIDVHSNQAIATNGQFRCRGRIEAGGGKPLAYDLTPEFADAIVTMPDQGLKAEKISLKVRLASPFDPEKALGHFKAGRLTFQDRVTARFSSELVQAGESTLRLTGLLSSPDLVNKDLAVNLKAGLDPEPWADGHANTTHFMVSDPSIRRLLPEADLPGDMALDMTADAWASYRYGKISSRAAVEIHSGTVEIPDMEFSARGITGILGIRDLVRLESYPGQMLSIQAIDAGQFRVENAVLRFSIEDREAMTLENLRFNWCNGLVSSEAVHIPAKDGILRLTLFCDRLEMASLLQQIGSFDTEGGGTLSGRIPVVYKNGAFSFENGFLFSAPGQGGRVFIKDLDRMLDSFPKGTPEFSYLDMAGEALKDFQYQWAKLRMNTSGDTLEVNMELDGKPSKVLPFTFSRQANAFVRVDASSPGAHFQGIKLDVNLKLPFNRMVKFGNTLKGMMD